MIEGSWVNLDGIEKAQPELAERILSLCDPINPYLNLLDSVIIIQDQPKRTNFIFMKISDF